MQEKETLCLIRPSGRVEKNQILSGVGFLLMCFYLYCSMKWNRYDTLIASSVRIMQDVEPVTS